MALKWLEGFEYFGVTDMGPRYNVLPTAIGQVQFLQGQSDTELYIGPGAFFSTAVIFSTTSTTNVIGIRLIVEDSLLATKSLLSLSNGSTAQWSVLIVPGSNSTKFKLRVVLGSGGATLLESGDLDKNTSIHVEIKIAGSLSSGSGELRINGASVDTTSGVQTHQDSVTLNAFLLAITCNGYYNDFYYVDDNAGAHTDFLGDLSVERINPTADFSAAWTKGGSVIGASNYEQVDDQLFDGDASYVKTNASSIKDRYNMEDVTPFVGADAIAGISIVANAKVSKAGSLNIRQVVYLDGVGEAFSADKAVNKVAYTAVEYIYEQNPITVANWTESELNDLILGFESRP